MTDRRNYYVYILLNPQGETYVGQTDDIQRRLEQHNDPDYKGSLHTKRHRGPWVLLHSEEYQTRADAMSREKELKTGTGRDWIIRTLLGKP
jgi:putative endonuclease